MLITICIWNMIDAVSCKSVELNESIKYTLPIKSCIDFSIRQLHFRLEYEKLTLHEFISCHPNFYRMSLYEKQPNARVKTGNFSYATLLRSCVLLYGKYRMEINALMNPEGKGPPDLYLTTMNTYIHPSD